MPQNHCPFRVSRRRLSLLALSGTFAALIIAFGGCNSAPKGPISVPLEYRPQHSDPIAGTLPTTDAKIHLEAVEDKRPNTDEIGKNVQGETPLPVFSSGKSPAEFIRGVLEQELQNFGLEMTDAPEAADRIISVDLTKFYVEESATYEAEVSATAEVRDKRGSTLWKGQMAGAGDNFGRSRSPINYQETLSDATRRAVGSLVTNPKFADALVK
jgi:hypothetical protein